MKISKIYSHMNGEEFLKVHHADLYQDIINVIKNVDAAKCKTKISKEKTMSGKLLYSPKELNASFKKQFEALGWTEKRYSYYITLDRELMQLSLEKDAAEQKEFLESRGEINPINSYKQTDFVKDKVAVEVQFGKYAFVAFDLFVKHMLFYSGGIINLGIEILPMKSMQAMMSSGVPYFEGEVYNVMRHGRNNPPIPLMIIGIVP
ncbi:MAG: restriction endonuclease [Candidatus Cloacimonetes bacterium]|nr:restriction endonuclease [Candidatus Cloacimonadota bacterium]NLO11579.1 restriction endonuclease [Candidatus Cloacimonadota bacterium]